ncbi:hypothetical protein PS15m_012185 [Mucor circinelloides]
MRPSATGDAEFLEFLSLLRTNDYASEHQFVLSYITKKCKLDEQIPREALRLFIENEQVDRYNAHCVDLLQGATIHLVSIDVGSFLVLKETCLFEHLQVKIGIPVLSITMWTFKTDG